MRTSGLEECYEAIEQNFHLNFCHLFTGIIYEYNHDRSNDGNLLDVMAVFNCRVGLKYERFLLFSDQVLQTTSSITLAIDVRHCFNIQQ